MGRRPHPRHARARPAEGGRLRLYGRHAVEAALANPARTALKLFATHEAAARLLGFADYAELSLATKMAGSPAEVATDFQPARLSALNPCGAFSRR